MKTKIAIAVATMLFAGEGQCGVPLASSEWVPLANLVLNALIIPGLLLFWRMCTAMIRIEQILLSHDQRITRTEKTIDTAAQRGDVDRRKAPR